MTSILCARIPWVHTHARVMLGTQEMENLAMVFKIQYNTVEPSCETTEADPGGGLTGL